MSNKKECIRFEKLPKNIDELKLMAQDCFESPFKMAALSVAVFCNYENDVDSTIEMLNYIKGPRELSPYDIQFIRVRLKGMGHVVRSYIKGSSPDNDYAISAPYEIEVEDNPYSYNNEGYATLYLKSSGADSPRPVTLRFKPSTNQWFLWEHTFLSSIRMPKSQEAWA